MDDGVQIDATSTFPERLKIAIGAKNVLSFATACGLSESVIRKYLLGKSEPTLSRLIAISKASDHSLEWLATGQTGAGIKNLRLERKAMAAGLAAELHKLAAKLVAEEQ